MISIFIGLIFMGVGLMGILRWHQDLLSLLRGMGPISLLLGGIVGIMAGISSFRSRRKSDGNK